MGRWILSLAASIDEPRSFDDVFAASEKDFALQLVVGQAGRAVGFFAENMPVERGAVVDMSFLGGIGDADAKAEIHLILGGIRTEIEQARAEVLIAADEIELSAASVGCERDLSPENSMMPVLAGLCTRPRL